jgi:hypothetical protein
MTKIFLCVLAKNSFLIGQFKFNRRNLIKPIKTLLQFKRMVGALEGLSAQDPRPHCVFRTARHANAKHLVNQTATSEKQNPQEAKARSQPPRSSFLLWRFGLCYCTCTYNRPWCGPWMQAHANQIETLNMHMQMGGSSIFILCSMPRTYIQPGAW